MTREEAKQLLPIIQAFAEGEIIECRIKPGTISAGIPNEWTEIKEIGFWNGIEYRIKLKPKYRSFKNAEECLAEMQKHQPFGWVKDTEANEYLNVYCISNSASSIDLFGRMFKRCIFIDGSPYGVKVEE